MKLRRLSTQLTISILLIAGLVIGSSIAVYTVLLSRNLDRIAAGEIASGREGVRLSVQERTRRALLIARFAASDERLLADAICAADPPKALEKYHRTDIDPDILTLIDGDGVILAQYEPRDPMTGERRDRRGEPLFLNPLFERAAQGAPAAGVELCMPDTVCVDAIAPVAAAGGNPSKLICYEDSSRGSYIQNETPREPPRYVRAGFVLDDRFARMVRRTTGTEFFLLRRNRSIASSLPTDQFSAEDARRLAEAVESASGGTARGRSETKLTFSKTPYAVAPAPLADASGREIARMVIGRSLADAAKARREAYAFLAGIAALGLALSLALGLFSAGRISRPIRDLLARVREVSAGRLDARTTPQRRDEIGELAGAFNEMTASLEERDRRLRDSADELRRNQDQLIQSGKLAAIGELAAGVAHEIGNPLSAISGYAQMIQEGRFTVAQTREFAGEIESEAEFIERIIQNLLEFSRPSENVMEPADLREIAESALKTASAHKLFGRLRVERRFDPDMPHVTCNRKEIQQVFLNLIMNAAQAMPNGGVISVEGETLPGRVRFSVRDAGPGVPREIRDKIFNPFFTTKPPGVGTGLGLAIAYRIVEKHGGALSLDDTPGGASFSFTLPLKR
jgi:signal transduction histidine kinase